MAITIVTTTMAGAINYTHVTDTPTDWSSVPNNTYFYNKSDKLTRYKDSSGNVVNLFESNYSLSGTGTNIHFSASTIFGSSTTPETGNITNTLTNSKLGVVQKIYHNSGSAPTVPAGWVLLGSTTYQISTLNIIYAEWARGNRVEYWVVR